MEDWKDEIQEDYSEYLDKCQCIEDCECMTFAQFERKVLHDLQHYFDDLYVSEIEEMLG